MLKPYFTWVFLGILLLMGARTQAQTKDYSVQSLSIVQFIKNIEWPDQKDADYIVGVMHSKSITELLTQQLKDKTVGSKKLLIKTLHSENDAEGCDVVFVPSSSRVNLSSLSKLVEKKPVLIVTEKEGMVFKGSDLNITTVNNQPKWEANTAAIEKKKFKVTASFMKRVSKVL